MVTTVPSMSQPGVDADGRLRVISKSGAPKPAFGDRMQMHRPDKV